MQQRIRVRKGEIQAVFDKPQNLKKTTRECAIFIDLNVVKVKDKNVSKIPKRFISYTSCLG